MITKARGWLENALTSAQFTYKELRSMYLALVLDQFFIMFIGMLSTAMVSSTGEAAMAASNMVNSVNNKTVLVVKADEYPFNILTKYAEHMTVEGNATVVNDLSYILSKLPENDRKALVNAVTRLISNAARENGVTLE